MAVGLDTPTPALSDSASRLYELQLLCTLVSCTLITTLSAVSPRTQHVRLNRPAAVCSTTLLLCYYVLLLFYVLLCFMCGVSQLVPEAPPRLHRASVTPRPWSLGELLVTEARPRLGGASGRGRSSPRRHRASDRVWPSDQGRTEPRALVVCSPSGGLWWWRRLGMGRHWSSSRKPSQG